MKLLFGLWTGRALCRKRGRRQYAGQAGLTLVEVMLALLILSMALGVMIRTSAFNLGAARDAEMMGVASELARNKMYDIEEELLAEGFQEIDQSLDGDFDEEGWPQISWKADIVKVELPNITSVGGGDDEGGSGAAGLLGGFAGMIPGLGAEGGSVDSAAAGGAALIGSQWELVSQVLEQSLRKVTLTLTWKFGRSGNDALVIDAYFTEPAAIGRSTLGQLAGAASAAAPSSDSTSRSDSRSSGSTPSGSLNTGVK